MHPLILCPANLHLKPNPPKTNPHPFPPPVPPSNSSNCPQSTPPNSPKTFFPEFSPLTLFPTSLFPQDLKGQYWTDDDSDGDNESEEFLYGVQVKPRRGSEIPCPLCEAVGTLDVTVLLQGTCAADLYRHPQLDADIEAVKEIYSENAVSVRWVRLCCDIPGHLAVTVPCHLVVAPPGSRLTPATMPRVVAGSMGPSMMWTLTSM